VERIMPAEALHRLMLVEDDDDVRAVACMALEAVGGFAVEQCSSGAEALQRIVALESALKPQLILLDVMMPGLDGREVLQALRKMPAHADIPVVFFTAKAQHEELRALSALGVAGILCKPFDPMTLSDQVRDIWRSL
jgi:CheY-like chemotaxis protein